MGLLVLSKAFYKRVLNLWNLTEKKGIKRKERKKKERKRSVFKRF